MTDKKSRRVVIINNIQSETIDQAIFILKSDKSDRSSKKPDANIAREAQLIIDNYVRQVERLKGHRQSAVHQKIGHKRRFRLKPWFAVSLIAAAVLSLCIFLTK